MANDEVRPALTAEEDAYLIEFRANLRRDFNKLPLRIPQRIRWAMEAALQVDAQARQLDHRASTLAATLPTPAVAEQQRDEEHGFAEMYAAEATRQREAKERTAQERDALREDAERWRFVAAQARQGDVVLETLSGGSMIQCHGQNFQTDGDVALSVDRARAALLRPAP